MEGDGSETKEVGKDNVNDSSTTEEINPESPEEIQQPSATDNENSTDSWETLSAEESGDEIGMQHNETGPCRCNMCLALMMAHSARVLERSSHTDFQLPETVTKIDASEGSTVYIVGTAHFSAESQAEVSQTIQALCPDLVYVELCRGRVSILHYDEEMLLQEAKDVGFAKLKMAVKKNGVISGVMQLLLLSMSAHLTKELGMAPGGEFRQAVKEARKIPGCEVRLCDRPVEITLARAMAALSVWQKVKLAWHMLTTRDSISKEDVERYKQKDMLAQMLAEMTGDFPALTNVFIKERDMYMANILSKAAQPLPVVDENGDVVGMEKSVIIAVVGIGHMEGIVNYFNTEVDVKELMKMPKTSRLSYVMKYTFRAAVVAALSWSVYKLVNWTRSYWP